GIVSLGRRDALAGILSAFAIAFKVYPALIVLPLAAQRRWRTLALLVVTLMALVLVSPTQWMRFVQGRMLPRGSLFRLDENGSLAVTFVYFGKLLTAGRESSIPDLFKALSGPTYALLLAATAFVDFAKRWSGRLPTAVDEDRADAALYLPFM